MINDKLRRQITCEAARLLYVRQESEFHLAKVKAARRIVQGRVRTSDLPTNREIRDEIQVLARMHLSGNGTDLRPFDNGELRPAGATSGSEADDEPGSGIERFRIYQTLLAPLETVKQDLERHPEGDALYHSLQVFALARDALPYDEEFQLAALLHDVGKAIDPREHVAAAVTALEGHVTQRTLWFIEHHSEATALRDGTLGARASPAGGARRLRQSATAGRHATATDASKAAASTRSGRCAGTLARIGTHRRLGITN